jgi:hypothetical protein
VAPPVWSELRTRLYSPLDERCVQSIPLEARCQLLRAGRTSGREGLAQLRRRTRHPYVSHVTGDGLCIARGAASRLSSEGLALAPPVSADDAMISEEQRRVTIGGCHQLGFALDMTATAISFDNHRRCRPLPSGLSGPLPSASIPVPIQRVHRQQLRKPTHCRVSQLLRNPKRNHTGCLKDAENAVSLLMILP